MFGAWQAGVWSALSQDVAPDLVVGASIGSINAWAVAGGCLPAELENYWLELRGAGNLKFRLPRGILRGLADGREMERTIREFHRRWQPQIEYGVVLTELLRLRPRLFRGPEVTAEHLLASCAVPTVYDQRRIGGKVYSDGGLLGASPVWAAVELGADLIISLDALANMPSSSLRYATLGLRRVARFRPPKAPESTRILRVAPGRPLGAPYQMLGWRRERIERWIAQGQIDGAEIKHCILKMF